MCQKTPRMQDFATFRCLLLRNFRILHGFSITVLFRKLLESLDSIYENYQSLLYLLRAKSNMETVLMVSGIPPRYGTNAQPLNMIHKDLCDNNKVFNDRHEYVKQQLFHPDGIHLSKKGTSTFLRTVLRGMCCPIFFSNSWT